MPEAVDAVVVLEGELQSLRQQEQRLTAKIEEAESARKARRETLEQIKRTEKAIRTLRGDRVRAPREKRASAVVNDPDASWGNQPAEKKVSEGRG